MIGYMLNINQIDSGGKNSFLITLVVLGLLLIKFENINLKKLNKSIIIISSIVIIFSIFLFCLGLQLSSDVIVMHQSIMTGIFTNSNQAGLIFLLLLILILNTSRKYSKITISISALLVISIVFTLSRASIIAMVILLFYFLIKNKKLLIVAFASILIFFISNSYVSNKLISKFTEQGSSHRTEIWSSIVSERTNSLENFFFGTGSNTTYFILDGGKLSAHSSIVNTFGNFGFIYLALISTFVLLILIYIRSNRLMMFSILAIIFNGFFETTLYSGAHFAWFTLLFLYSIKREIKKEKICIY
ncbi:O-antigen ligase family protein [Aliarcobacter butzleri]|uniref:O-antigen ligase family protein n=2 Tax=Aliarcobacter butzleri TaxID=28197 RepID=UPI003AF5BC1D